MIVFKYIFVLLNWLLQLIISISFILLKAHSKTDDLDKNEKIRQKVSKLLVSQEEFAGKLLKIFSKKLDEIQVADRDLAAIRHT